MNESVMTVGNWEVEMDVVFRHPSVTAKVFDHAVVMCTDPRNPSNADFEKAHAFVDRLNEAAGTRPDNHVVFEVVARRRERMERKNMYVWVHDFGVYFGSRLVD